MRALMTSKVQWEAPGDVLPSGRVSLASRAGEISGLLVLCEVCGLATWVCSKFSNGCGASGAKLDREDFSFEGSASTISSACISHSAHARQASTTTKRRYFEGVELMKRMPISKPGAFWLSKPKATQGGVGS